MGYDRHHIIVVTTYDRKKAIWAREEALAIFDKEMHLAQERIVSPIFISPINCWGTFFICPDGSNEGWGESDEGDEKRKKFIDWLDSQRYEDGSSPYDWAEVQYGDDEYETKITNDSDERSRKETKEDPEANEELVGGLKDLQMSRMARREPKAYKEANKEGYDALMESPGETDEFFEEIAEQLAKALGADKDLVSKHTKIIDELMDKKCKQIIREVFATI